MVHESRLPRSMEFLPIRVAQTEEEQPAVREYCRANGIYVPE